MISEPKTKMNKYMMTILVLMFTLYINLVVGMDSYSDVSVSSDGDLEFLNDFNKRYIPKKYEIKENSNVANFHKPSEEDFNKVNELKRKHQSEKFCEFCRRKSSTGRLTNSKYSNYALCAACYVYEHRNGKFVPLNERKQREKHKNNILVCEFCQQESVRYKKSQVCGKVLCQPCYNYERRYGHAKLVDKRKKYHRKNKKIGNDQTYDTIETKKF
jgi:hypothetical protein